MEKASLKSKIKVSGPTLVTRKLCKTYPNGTRALVDADLEIHADQFMVIIGSSGAGKSTYLRCMNRLIEPSSGEMELLGVDITHAGGGKLRQARRRVGMIFQQFNLVKRLTVLQNVLAGRLRFQPLPLAMMRVFPKHEKLIAFECLKKVGIAQLAYQRADTLSGGQQQRVAIARALAQEPDLLLADEPIASLDPHSSRVVMDILAEIQETQKIPVVVNLHQLDIAKDYGKRIVGMRDGRIVFDGNAQALDMNAVEQIYGKKIEGLSGLDTPKKTSVHPPMPELPAEEPSAPVVTVTN